MTRFARLARDPLAAASVLLLAACQGSVTESIVPSAPGRPAHTAMHTPDTPIPAAANETTRRIPPIDARAPAAIQTATFALG